MGKGGGEEGVAKVFSCMYRGFLSFPFRHLRVAHAGHVDEVEGVLRVVVHHEVVELLGLARRLGRESQGLVGAKKWRTRYNVFICLFFPGRTCRYELCTTAYTESGSARGRRKGKSTGSFCCG